MDRHSIDRRRGWTFWVPALFAVLAVVTMGAAPGHAQTDTGVTHAETALAGRRAEVDRLEKALDKTAESYEHANAHRVRIEDELQASGLDLQQADQAIADAQTLLGKRVAAAYMHPGADMVLADALLTAPDAASALHRAALYRRVAARTADAVGEAQWASDLTRTDVRQESVIAAGAQASVDEWHRQADALTQALADAKQAVAGAQAQLRTARAEAARRAEEERRRQAQANVVMVGGSAPAGPLPAVDGKVCPIGTPNGFIDSWGFPRSGGRTHQGVDMFAAYGTPLYAVADGVIHRVYTNPLGGLAINLIDTDGNMYYYAHLSSASVTAGQKVRAGDVIGANGDSGNARGTPPHLHWQYHPGNGAAVNPYPLAYALCR